MLDPTLTGAENPEGTQPADAKASAKADKLYSQEDLDHAIGERLAREKAKSQKGSDALRAAAVQEWREQQGLDDESLELLKKLPPADARAAAERAEKAKSTRLANEAEGWKKKAEAARAELESEKRTGALLRAASGKSHDPDAVVMHLLPRVKMLDDFSVVVVDEKGEPTSKTIEEAVTDLLIKKPYLVPASGHFDGAGSRGASGLPAAEGKEFWRTAEGRAARIAKAYGDRR